MSIHWIEVKDGKKKNGFMMVDENIKRKYIHRSNRKKKLLKDPMRRESRTHGKDAATSLFF